MNAHVRASKSPRRVAQNPQVLIFDKKDDWWVRRRASCAGNCQETSNHSTDRSQVVFLRWFLHLSKGRCAQLCARDRADQKNADVEEERVHQGAVGLEGVDGDEKEAACELDRT